MAMVHVHGRKSGQITLYGLSTCGWCQKTKKLLDELGVEYDYEYVDQTSGEERARAMHEVTTWNPAASFPTMVIDNQRSIIGFNEVEIRKVAAR